jgi:hypothetical protein
MTVSDRHRMRLSSKDLAILFTPLLLRYSGLALTFLSLWRFLCFLSLFPASQPATAQLDLH